MMVRYSQAIFNLFVAVFLAGLDVSAAVAQQNNILLQKLMQIKSDPVLGRQAMYAGEERALICGYCHGNDGNSLKPDVPNLAGQNPDYLLEQVGRFARGERKDYVMNSLAGKFTEDEQINLAIYYAAQKVKPSKFDYARAVLGKPIYLERCQSCHGNHGRGNKGYARLAGQQPAYIQMTLEHFRNYSLGKATDKKRRSAVMEPIAGRLSDQDIRNLAAYIASM